MGDRVNVTRDFIGNIGQSNGRKRKRNMERMPRKDIVTLCSLTLGLPFITQLVKRSSLSLPLPARKDERAKNIS